MQVTAIPPNPLAQYVPFTEYVQERPQFFPKRGTPNYFLRFRREALLAEDIIYSTAEGDYIHPEKADAFILDLGRKGESYRTHPQPQTAA
jgi:hypothetical protein